MASNWEAYEIITLKYIKSAREDHVKTIACRTARGCTFSFFVMLEKFPVSIAGLRGTAKLSRSPETKLNIALVTGKRK